MRPLRVVPLLSGREHVNRHSDWRARYFRAAAPRKPTQLPMTKQSFRLAYLHARRPLRVDGLDPVDSNASPLGRIGRELIRGPTEACRAIHGHYHEPQTARIGGNSLRALHHILVFGQVGLRHHRHCAERLYWRRVSNRVGFGNPRSDLTGSWSDDAGDGGLARPAKSSTVPARSLEL